VIHHARGNCERYKQFTMPNYAIALGGEYALDSSGLVNATANYPNGGFDTGPMGQIPHVALITGDRTSPQLRLNTTASSCDNFTLAFEPATPFVIVPQFAFHGFNQYTPTISDPDEPGFIRCDVDTTQFESYYYSEIMEAHNVYLFSSEENTTQYEVTQVDVPLFNYRVTHNTSLPFDLNTNSGSVDFKLSTHDYVVIWDDVQINASTVFGHADNTVEYTHSWKIALLDSSFKYFIEVSGGSSDPCNNFWVQYGYDDAADTRKYKELAFTNQTVAEGFRCRLDANDKLTLSQLADTTGIFLVTTESVNATNAFHLSILTDESDPHVQAIDEQDYYVFSVESYLFHKISTGMMVELHVQENFHPQDSSFHDLNCTTTPELVLANLSIVNDGDNGGCTLFQNTFTSETVDGENGNVQKYNITFNMSTDEFENCSLLTRNMDSGNWELEYSGNYLLPATGKSDADLNGTNTCKWFHQNELQAPADYKVFMHTTAIDVDGNFSVQNFAIVYSNIQANNSACESTSYLRSVGQLSFDATVYYSGDHEWDTFPVPDDGAGSSYNNGSYFADSVSGSSLDIELFGTSDGNNCDDTTKTCLYTIKSKNCHRLYKYIDSATDEETCVFDQSEFPVFHSKFTETLDDGSQRIHDIKQRPWIERESFDGALCDTEYVTENEFSTDVSDQYNVALSVQNYKQSVTPDWAGVTASTKVRFYDSMIVKLSIDTVNSDGDLHFDLLSLTVYSGETIIREKSISRDLVAASMRSGDTRFEKGPYFCRWYEKDLSISGNKCKSFFEAGSDRVNTEITNGILASGEYDVICKENGVTQEELLAAKKEDFLVINLKEWFEGAALPEGTMKLQVTAVGLVQQCTADLPTRRRSNDITRFVLSESTVELDLSEVAEDTETTSSEDQGGATRLMGTFVNLVAVAVVLVTRG